jgi:uncharacterized RDD family membrane protein YckC
VDAALDNTMEVETPERVRFRHHIAGPTRRGAAWTIDLLIRSAIGFVLFIILSLASGEVKKPQTAMGVMFVVFFLLEWSYYVLCETAGNGRTPGKAIMGLRVVKEGGYPLSFIDSVLRNLLRAADFLPAGYVLGGLVMAADRRFRRLGDLVAGTMVIIEEAHKVTAAVTLAPPATADELAALPHRIPLRAEELEAIDLFLRRRLSDARTVELAEVVTPVLARRLAVPAPGDPARFLGLVHARATRPKESAPRRPAR